MTVGAFGTGMVPLHGLGTRIGGILIKMVKMCRLCRYTGWQKRLRSFQAY